VFISAKAYFSNKIDYNKTVLIRAETALPQEFIRIYKKNVVAITPKKTGALRRSIITQASGNQANISWRSRYARAQNEGGHNGAVYRNYTTPGTGAHFANIAYKKTMAQMPAVVRELGLTK